MTASVAVGLLALTPKPAVAVAVPLTPAAESAAEPGEMRRDQEKGEGEGIYRRDQPAFDTILLHSTPIIRQI